MKPVQDDRTLRINVEVAEKPHARTLWGQRHRVHPKFIPEVLGDGGRLLIVTPLDTRPEYYLIRVDSAWELDSTTKAEDHVCDHLDEIYNAIEDECGQGYEDADESSTGRAHHNPWPALSCDSGVSWGEVTGKELDDLLEKEDKL